MYLLRAFDFYALILDCSEGFKLLINLLNKGRAADFRIANWTSVGSTFLEKRLCLLECLESFGELVAVVSDELCECCLFFFQGIVSLGDGGIAFSQRLKVVPQPFDLLVEVLEDLEVFCDGVLALAEDILLPIILRLPYLVLSA